MMKVVEFLFPDGIEWNCMLLAFDSKLTTKNELVEIENF